MAVQSTHILVVEANEDIREYLDFRLIDESYVVFLVSEGQSALTIALEHPIELILLDVQMPIMSGDEFLQRYRKRSSPDVPIMMSATSKLRFTCPVEVADFVSTPFDNAELLKCIEGILTSHP